MSWNYRIIKHDTTKPNYFAVHEVYYDEKGNITDWTTEPINVVGDSKRDLLTILKQINRDIEQVVLIESKIQSSLNLDKDYNNFAKKYTETLKGLAER